MAASGLEGSHLPFLPRGGSSVGLGTRWPSSPLAPAAPALSSWVTGTPSSKSISWTVQWMEARVDLRGIVHRCPRIVQSSLACTGLTWGRQRARWSSSRQGHSPVVSILHNTHSPWEYACQYIHILYFVHSCKHTYISLFIFSIIHFMFIRAHSIYAIRVTSHFYHFYRGTLKT